MADRVSDNIDVEASPQDILDVVADFESYPQWNANINKAKVLETDAEGRASQVWFEVDAKVRTVSYTLAYDYSGAPESLSWDLIEGDVKELSGSYSFDEFDGVTEVTYELAVDPGFPVPGPLKRQAQRRILQGGLEDLKKRVESSR